jgi:hypothetical protein
MFNWITCYLSGRHDYHVACEPGAIFLRCHNCGGRSTGWELHADRASSMTPVPVMATAQRAAHVRTAQQRA